MFILTGCGRETYKQFQGYIEGEFVYVSSPLAGTLKTLWTKRGDQVKAGDPLFELDNTPEKAAMDEAERRLAQARANYADAKKGKRPSEIQSMKAHLEQAKAALVLAEKEFIRQEKLVRIPGASAEQDLDKARSVREQERQRVAQLESDLKTAGLGSRTDQIAASEENMKALEALLAKARWNLAQKTLQATRPALVFNTMYREGEWVGQGRPVVALLPPQNIKVRFFVPETITGTVRPGDTVSVLVDGMGTPLAGKVSFISPQAEYTPPVIYSRESRSKLVFMIEAVFDPETAKKLQPGQPVDVRLDSRS
jgi:HlyD family secretion protein